MMNFKRILTALGLIRDTLRISKDGTTVIGYDGLPRQIVIPKSVTEIGDRAFEGCSGLTSIVIPESVTKIGEKAFKGCSKLTSIVIPESVTKIGEKAFKGCSKLTSIVIPESVAEIGEKAFKGCRGLNRIVIPKSVTSIGNEAFEGCIGLASIVIPESVTEIGEKAFKGCSGLNSIVIPKSVTSIGNEAFEGCSWLTRIVIPESVTKIGEKAFKGCRWLNSIVIPKSVTWIRNDAFDGCNGLTSIVIPESVTKIGDGAFKGCSKLTSIVIPESVTWIGRGAFCGCSKLTSIVIPESVTWIGEKAFIGCSRLTRIVVSKDNKRYDSRENCNAIIDTESNVLISGCSGTEIPKSVTKIGRGAFCGCSKLTSIVIPESVTWIGNDAFNGCSGLTRIVIPESVTEIGNEAFLGCSGLTSIVIPESVTKIGDGAFNGCSKLTRIVKSKGKKEFEKQLLLAQQGDAEAQYTVSNYYYNGLGTEQNLSEADKWLEESAKNGFGPAYLTQAQFLAENDENGSKAEAIFSLTQKALDNGCTAAGMPLGKMCLNGFGCEKSVEKAMKIFRVGMVAELKSDGDMNSFLNDLADVSEEMHTICKKAQSGDGDAFYQLGVLLWHKQEYDLSYKFMVASAAFGCMNGVHELGRDYYYGYGVEANMEVAEDLWTYAASHGNAAALRELGDLCTDREEYAQAYHYYLDSAKGGDDKGRIGVAECYLEGSGCEKNVHEAIKWLNRILKKNNAQPGFNWNTQWVQCAMLWLGGIYLGQDGDEFKNMNKAIATLKDGLELKDRFTTEIAQVLASIYGDKNGDYYNPQEAKKYQEIAEESQGPGNVIYYGNDILIDPLAGLKS